MCFYSICISTIKTCSYWNDQTLSALAGYGMLMYEEALNDGNEFTHDYTLQIINICGADVEVQLSSRHQGTLVSNAISSKQLLKRLISDNTTDNTGFFIWLSNYCVACIFRHPKKRQNE